MKARVKATGEELEVHLVDKQARYIGSDGITYWEEDLDFGIEDNNTLDYWTKLEHQYAGQFMQAMISSSNYIDVSEEAMADASFRMAHALVEKYKKEDSK